MRRLAWLAAALGAPVRRRAMAEATCRLESGSKRLLHLQDLAVAYHELGGT
ncbi:MAG TPA: hypothetical protein VMI06_18370 [Terriglobia bacterium]|nr:hypothetical protein [Terriglobia bacterium]